MALHGRRQQPVLPLLYFVAVGLGYILVEIAFIQRFVLFLGHPTYALTVVIFLMLLSSGAGSLFFPAAGCPTPPAAGFPWFCSWLPSSCTPASSRACCRP